MSGKPDGKKRRIRNPAATRARLLQATVELVTEKGAAGLSLKEAAGKANVSRGVAYLHFEDREQLLNEAKAWIAAQLAEGVQRRSHKKASLHERTTHTTMVVLKHPEATKQMIIAAMAGTDLAHDHPLYKLVSNMLRELKESGNARADLDLEILTYIMFGSIAATVVLGERRKGEDLQALAEWFAEQWNQILLGGIFVQSTKPGESGSLSARSPKRAKPVRQR